MITSAPDGGVTSLGVSPIRGSPKHEMTPFKIRRKTSRKDQAIDVHTTCSTPNRFDSPKPHIAFNSPSDSFPCSQDHRPDVIWDYTSPKLPKGECASKKEMQITVDEFLKNLSHNQAPQCNTQNSQYIKILEMWMAKQNTPVCVKQPARIRNRDNKKRSRRVLDEIKEFMESMQQKKEEKIVENNGEDSVEDTSKQKSSNLNNSISSVDRKSFLEGDSPKNDSIDELWGDADNSFIVKATQHVDISCLKYETENKNLEIVSMIPETAAETSNEMKNSNSVSEKNTDSLLNKTVLDPEYQAQIFLTQIINCGWDSDSDNGDLENGFIMGDEDLSLIPDEVLCGGDSNCDKKIEAKEQESTVSLTCDDKTKDNKSDFQSNNDKNGSTNRSLEITFGCSESTRVTCERANISEVELFNNFEDDDFEDELMLTKPEVLSWIDEVESKSSQSLKCTPEEIEKKKDEAIQRRKKNLSKRKS